MRLIIWLLLCNISCLYAQQSIPDCQNLKRRLPLKGGGFVTDPANVRSDTLDILHFDISLNFREVGSQFISGTCRIDLRSLVNDVNLIHFDLLALTVDSVYTESTSLTFGQSGESLFVVPQVALDAGDSVSVFVAYHGQPQQDNSWGGFYFNSGYAYNLGVGFDAIPHNFARVWFPCFDNFVERSSYDFHILTTDNRRAYCNGIRLGIEDVGEDSLLNHWTMQESIPSYLAGIAVAAYTHAELEYVSLNGDTIPMWLTALPGDTTNMKLSFTHLDEAMLAFEEHFGPYRWSKVGFTAVPFNAGAMEHATCIAYPRLLLDGSVDYETLMAHELSHHWWGDLVTCRTAEDMWLNEGWASFCEMIFTEALYGEEAYREALRDNHKDVLIFAHRNDGARFPVSGVPLNLTYGDHVYNRGADIARTLRSFMGDESFFEACRSLMIDRPFADISSSDLRDFFQQFTDVDLTTFFDQWVFDTGFPEFRIQQWSPSANDSYLVQIKQYAHYSSSLYSSVPLRITFWDALLNNYHSSVLVGGEFTEVEVTVPQGFVPVHVALNTDDRIALAVLGEERIITNNGPNDCDFAELDIVMNDLPDDDSVYVHVENHFADADPSFVIGDYYVSPDRWWRVFRSGDIGTAVATIRYYGDSTESRYLDPLFFDYVSAAGYVEDSIVLLYRANPSQPWALHSNYELLSSPGVDNWEGRIRILNLLSGDYAWAVPRSPLVTPSYESSTPAIYTKPGFLVGRYLSDNAQIIVSDNTGRLIMEGTCKNVFEWSTAGWSTGIYFVQCIQLPANLRRTFKVYVP